MAKMWDRMEEPTHPKDVFAAWLASKAQQAVVRTEMRRYDGDLDAYVEERGGSPDRKIDTAKLRVLVYPGAFVAQHVGTGEVYVYDNVYFPE